MATYDAGRLESDYSFLDQCPPELFPTVVTFPQGTLQERVAGVRQWLDSLLDGTLPPAGTWPGAPIDTPVREALGSMGIARFCKGQTELVDSLIKDILSAFVRKHEVFQSEVTARMKELQELERIRLRQEAGGQRKRSPNELDEETLQRFREQALEERANAEQEADRGLLGTWEPRVRLWAQISDVFGDLGEIMGRGWDMSLGVLKHVGWLEMLRLRDLIEKLPQLQEIVRTLGRLHDSESGASVAETIFEPVERLEEERLEIRTPLVPAEMRGIERSGEIARMLPAEAMMLGHPQLRLLWHARRAERALLTYRVEGVEYESTWTEREEMVEREGKKPRPERGPILAIIDTSGSMHGVPEQVAKALVLEAARTAHAEKRQCFLYAYSGPGQVMEHELSLSPEGMGNLLSFLRFSFGGGNDETGVMGKAVARLKENDWKKADVVFVSDGEWPAPAKLVQMVEQARDEGTRFHGVQIGNRGRTGLHAVCDPVHVFQDWAAAGGWR